MRVFISWSGESSQKLADVFRRWLPSVLQAVTPYFTPEDVEKGARWQTEIAQQLDACEAGILIMTPDNLRSPWLMFEAGALSTRIESTRVIPLLFDVDPVDIKGPLVQFQSCRFRRPEVFRVLRTLNELLGDRGLSSDVLHNVFTMWWPRLKDEVKRVLSEMAAERPADPIRSDRDLLVEVLELSRLTAGDAVREKVRAHRDHPAVLPWDEWWDRVLDLARLLRDSFDNGRYVPDAVLGISNGGLIVADLLVREALKGVPVLSLWANRQDRERHGNPDPSCPMFDNEFNKSLLATLNKTCGSKKELRVVLVDDLVFTSNTVRQAERMLRRELGERCEILFTPLCCRDVDNLGVIEHLLPFGSDERAVFPIGREQYYRGLLTDYASFPYRKVLAMA